MSVPSFTTLELSLRMDRAGSTVEKLTVLERALDGMKREAVNKALDEVGALMDVLISVCMRCHKVTAVHASENGSTGASHGLCDACDREAA